MASSAHAALGRSAASVETDRARLAVKATSTALATHTVHSLTLANGGVVRELVGANGVVFAVSWRGPGRPDLRQLLGDRFDTFQSDNLPPSGRRTRRPLLVDRTDFVVRSAGHPGAFFGFALLPQEAPAGFSLRDLQ